MKLFVGGRKSFRYTEVKFEFWNIIEKIVGMELSFESMKVRKVRNVHGPFESRMKFGLDVAAKSENASSVISETMWEGTGHMDALLPR